MCGRSAIDPVTRRTWWLLANEKPCSGLAAPDEGYASAPPTCHACIPAAITACPHLRTSAAVYSVGGCEPYAILAHLFQPTSDGRAILCERDVIIGLEEFQSLERALAHQLFSLLWDLRPEPTYFT